MCGLGLFCFRERIVNSVFFCSFLLVLAQNGAHSLLPPYWFYLGFYTFLNFLHFLHILDFPSVSHAFLSDLWENQEALRTSRTARNEQKVQKLSIKLDQKQGEQDPLFASLSQRMPKGRGIERAS